MIFGIGTDIIEIKRIKKAIESHGGRFIEHLFTENEKKYCEKYKDSAPHFAGRFAAKEAVLKALGTGLKSPIGWHDIEIQNTPEGKPVVILSDILKNLFPNLAIYLSISHCETYATATALIEEVT